MVSSSGFPATSHPLSDMDVTPLIREIAEHMVDANHRVDIVGAALSDAVETENEFLREAFCPGVENAWALAENAEAWGAEVRRLRDSFNDEFGNLCRLIEAFNRLTAFNLRTP